MFSFTFSKQVVIKCKLTSTRIYEYVSGVWENDSRNYVSGKRISKTCRRAAWSSWRRSPWPPATTGWARWRWSSRICILWWEAGKLIMRTLFYYSTWLPFKRYILTFTSQQIKKFLEFFVCKYIRLHIRNISVLVSHDYAPQEFFVLHCR